MTRLRLESSRVEWTVQGVEEGYSTTRPTLKGSGSWSRVHSRAPDPTESRVQCASADVGGFAVRLEGAALHFPVRISATSVLSGDLRSRSAGEPGGAYKEPFHTPRLSGRSAPAIPPDPRLQNRR
jgi:hypothetical protein